MPNEGLSYLDSLLPMNADVLTIKEIAAATGYTPKTIFHAYDQGGLRGFEICGRGKAEARRRHPRIPRNIALVFLLSSSNDLSDSGVAHELEALVSRFPLPVMQDVNERITKRIDKVRSHSR